MFKTGIYGKLFCILVAMFQMVSVASGQNKGTISGTVSVVESKEALPGANVSVVGTMRGTSVFEDGTYSLKMEPGSYVIRASFIGYSAVEKPVQVVSGEEVTVDFELVETPVEFGESLVVLGSRTARTAVETPVPVDVISARAIRESPITELNQTLTFLAPSFNASHQTISDGTDHINPASLRGLGPDQTLVLINGKRRHPAALVNVNGTFGRGTVGIDLNSIPQAAIERVEILRDGAAAQYGSDAIAGVINIVLKEQTEGIQVNTVAGSTGEGDGDQVLVDGNYGFRIGERGFVNVTGSFLNRGRTNRSDPFQGPLFFSDRAADDAEIARRGLTRRELSMKTGQSEAVFGAGFFNAAYAISDNAELYGYGGISHRDGGGSGFYRRPIQEERVVFEIFPNGFLPEIHTEIRDIDFTGGLRGNHKGWDVDFSIKRGRNEFTFNIENTNNASLGTASPTSFDAGTLEFAQTVGNLDLVKPIDTKGAVNSLSLALGAEFRVENFQIGAGQFESYSLGNGGDRPGVDFDTTSTGSPKASGSQVFPGFQPANEVDRFRNSLSVYTGLEAQVTDQWLVDVGARFETYDDFGEVLIGKAATRYEVADNFALRGAVSSGFRAPSLHQVWLNSISTQFVLDPASNELVATQVLTANNKSPVTRAFGIPGLKEETSINISGGFTARPHPKLSFTADAYYIAIDDRIVLTSRFTSANPTFARILEPFQDAGVSSAQFFANAVDTETKGLDLVAAYFTPLGRGKLNVTASASFTNTDVDKINVPTALAEQVLAGESIDAVKSTLFNREERNRLEDALPRTKGNLMARYSIDRWNLMTRASLFGNVKYKPTNEANDETFDAKVLFDVDVGFEVLTGVNVHVGANNVFDTFPDKHQKAANISNGNFPYSRRVTQFGMNGGFYYGKLQFNL